MPLSLTTHFFDTVYVIRCSGRIVAGEELKALEAALELGAREFSRIVLNLEDLDRLDSTGLGLLVRFVVRLRKRGGDLRFAAVPPFVMALLSLTMLSIVEVKETEREALTSFVNHPSAPKALENRGIRVMIVDEEADMCVFIATVLQQHGYHVSSAICLHDARILLEAGRVAYIIVGPNAPQLPFEEVAGSLNALAPGVIPLRLDPGFKTLTALEAAHGLLGLLAGGQPSRVESIA